MYQKNILYLSRCWVNKPKHVAEFLTVNIDYQHVLCLVTWLNYYIIAKHNWMAPIKDMTKLIVAFRNYAKAHKKFYVLCTECIYVLCMYLRKKSDFGRHSSMCLVFKTELGSVYWAARTGSLNETDYDEQF